MEYTSVDTIVRYLWVYYPKTVGTTTTYPFYGFMTQAEIDAAMAADPPTVEQRTVSGSSIYVYLGTVPAGYTAETEPSYIYGGSGNVAVLWEEKQKDKYGDPVGIVRSAEYYEGDNSIYKYVIYFYGVPSTASAYNKIVHGIPPRVDVERGKKHFYLEQIQKQETS